MEEYVAGEPRVLSKEEADMLHHSIWRKEGTEETNCSDPQGGK